MIKEIDLKVRKKRAAWRADKISNFIEHGSSVINIGAGDCFISEFIAEKTNARFANIDVVNTNLTNQKLIIYGGGKIPFGNKEFDYALLLHVLHHALGNQEGIIKEAARVANKIIIFEDKYQSLLDLFFLKILHLYLNITQKWKGKVKFRKPEEWKRFFEDLGLEVEKIEFINFKISGIVFFILK